MVDRGAVRIAELTGCLDHDLKHRSEVRRGGCDGAKHFGGGRLLFTHLVSVGVTVTQLLAKCVQLGLELLDDGCGLVSQRALPAPEPTAAPPLRYHRLSNAGTIARHHPGVKQIVALVDPRVRREHRATL